MALISRGYSKIRSMRDTHTKCRLALCYTTGMVKKVGPELRELLPAVREREKKRAGMRYHAT